MESKIFGGKIQSESEVRRSGTCCSEWCTKQLIRIFYVYTLEIKHGFVKTLIVLAHAV